MLLPDVNILVYAFRRDVPQHSVCRPWLERLLDSGSSFGMADLAISGFLRIVTNQDVFKKPSPLNKAIDFAFQLRSHANCVVVAPGERHFEIFASLCRVVGATGNLVPDAYFAALAIESGCEWVTLDRDYRYFPGLRWRGPS